MRPNEWNDRIWYRCARCGKTTHREDIVKIDEKWVCKWCAKKEEKNER